MPAVVSKFIVYNRYVSRLLQKVLQTKPCSLPAVYRSRVKHILWMGAIVVPMKSPVKKKSVGVFRLEYVKAAEITGARLCLMQGEMIHIGLLVLKLLKFLLLFTPVLLFIPLLYMGEDNRARWYNYSVATVEQCGATAIKLGQWASTRPDIFSPEFCNAFSKLQRHVTPHNFKFTKYKLRQRFGKNWKKIIVGLDQTPVGSGCVAQVYHANLCLNGITDEEVVEVLREEFVDNEDEVNWFEGLEVLGFRRDDDSEQDEDSSYSCGENLIPIAIKVLHPGIRQSVLSDLSVLSTFASIIETLVPPLRYLSLVESVEEFSKLIRQQIDLRTEANNMERFTSNFEDNNDIRFPRPLRPYVWRDLIVQSYEEGVPISHFLPGHISQEAYMETECENEETVPSCKQTLPPTQDPAVRDLVATMGLNALLDMIFKHNFVHADLHPGNLAVQVAGPIDKNEKVELVNLFDTVMVQVTPRENPLTLVMYDCGIVTKLPPEKHESITQVFRAIVTGDGQKVGQLFVDHSVLSRTTNKEAFICDMANLITHATKDNLIMADVHVGKLFGDFFRVLSSHRVKLDSNFVNIMIAVIVLEGLGRSLDPKLDILTVMKKYLLS